MIDAFGGSNLFYGKYFIGSVSPIGFIKEGKNYNYYDESILEKVLAPYIVYQMTRLLELKLKTKKIICLGEGKNFKFLSALNDKHKWFDEIIPLAHPRFIMQYKRKQMDAYIDQYIKDLNTIL